MNRSRTLSTGLQMDPGKVPTPATKPKELSVDKQALEGSISTLTLNEASGPSVMTMPEASVSSRTKGTVKGRLASMTCGTNLSKRPSEKFKLAPSEAGQRKEVLISVSSQHNRETDNTGGRYVNK